MKKLMVLLISALFVISLIGIAAAGNESASNKTTDSNETTLVVSIDDNSSAAPPAKEPDTSSNKSRDIKIVKVTKLPDQASIYCQKRGFSPEVRVDSTGKEYKVCVFPDGNECDQFEFLREKCGREYKNVTKEQLVKKGLDSIKEDLRKGNCKDGCALNVGEKKVTIKDLSAGRRAIIAEKINARTGLNLTAEDVDDKTVLRAYLSNGRWALVKYLPDNAAKRAEEKLQLKCANRNCTVELKEVGIKDEAKLAYEVKASKDSTVLLLFSKKMPVTAQVDAETGKVTSVKKPWWAFLARESTE